MWQLPATVVPDNPLNRDEMMWAIRILKKMAQCDDPRKFKNEFGYVEALSDRSPYGENLYGFYKVKPNPCDQNDNVWIRIVFKLKVNNRTINPCDQLPSTNGEIIIDRVDKRNSVYRK